MEEGTNIITVRNSDIHAADKAFAEFMALTENYMNEKTKVDNSLYKKCKGTEMEPVVLDILREISPQTPFRADNIRLISGARFPDIVAEKYYGVEVKTTKENCWRSTGSSIVESTRVEDVSRIYMLFGNLGSNPAMFRCRPYENCLSNIAVTHSPRYMIDMELAECQDQNIFSKMRIDYDTFRLMDDKAKISRVRHYYKEQAKARGKLEMPWWMGDDDTARVSLSFYNDLSTKDKENINVRMFILFPCIFNREYKRVALWLCNRYALLCHNMRDTFTAGGKVSHLGDMKLSSPVPRIVDNLYRFREAIKTMLKFPDKALMQDIEDNWHIDCAPRYYYGCWLKMLEMIFKENAELSQVDIYKLFED